MPNSQQGDRLGTNKQELFVSVVALIGDNAAVLPAFVGEVASHLSARYSNYEVVLVDNGAAGAAVATVRKLLEQQQCVRLVRLSRKLDDETAILAGLDATIGDFVVTMDPDLDPPADIGVMIEQCQAGSDLVMGVDRGRLAAGPAYRLARRVLIPLVRWIIGVRLVRGATLFRAMDRQAVNAITQHRARKQYFQVVAADVGLATATHHYQSICRSGTRPRPRLFHAMRIGLSILVQNSTTLLRLVSILGIVGSFLSLAASLYVVIVYLVKRDVMPGWTTQSLMNSGLFFLVFVILTLIGEYLGRLLEQTSDRPAYYVREEQSSAVLLTDQSRRNVLHQSVEDARSTTEAR